MDVNENYIARVKPGQRVMATLDAYPDWQIPAHVRTMIPTADREKGHGESARPRLNIWIREFCRTWE